MNLVRIVGTLVATHKDPKLQGSKLLIGKEIRLDGSMTETYHVAIDTVGAGMGEVVLVVRGSSARMTDFTKDKPVDSAIVAVIDEIEVAGEIVWRKEAWSSES
ncbi:MAG: EutN/CcmL family microcompartment protein [Anaerolineales bacterium]|jgi:microcompartment protein CcmK/EutM|nr:EutN/CcmL family microcompartment protein [Anaerolineales bacterium]